MPVSQNHSRKNLHRQDCLCHLLDGLGLGNVSEKIQDAALKLGGLKAESGGVECAGDFPHLFGAAGRGVNALRVAAGKRFVSFVADQEDGEGARRDGVFGGDFGDGEVA